ncbi:MAG: hypothetical protein J6Q87_03735 [Clostridia bacterium]|nr:hypothetical protein [Clostridia bacterium]
MNIQSINEMQSVFGAKVNLAKSKEALYKYRIDDFFAGNKHLIEKYADAHGISDVNLCLRECASKIKTNGHGDSLLLINAGPKTTYMRYDNTVTDTSTRKAILENIQENYNIINKK